MTGVLIGNREIVTGNLLIDYSVIRDTSMGQVTCCVSGLGPNAGDDNTALGLWYFNGAPLPYGLCEVPTVYPIQPRVANLQNVVGVINLWQCMPSLTPAAEGVYTCVILDSSMVSQTTGLGVYFGGRSESLNVLHHLILIALYIAAPMIDPPSSSTVTVAAGSDLRLSCTSLDSPPDTFTWRKDSGPIVQSTAVEYTSTIAVFHADYSIDSVTTSDSGTYTSTVTNPLGSDSETFTVIVVGTFLMFIVN